MRKFLIPALLCPFLSSAQLSIGDKLPTSSLNSKLKDQHSKLLLLDFWATWCTSCLHSFPMLDSLQQQFKDSLQIILINEKSSHDNQKKVTAFFQKFKKLSGDKYNFTMLVEDTVFSRLFPHKLIPHYVWIRNNRVVAITSSAEVTASNIRAFLRSSTPSIRTKTDVMNFNRHKPLFMEGNGGNGSAVRFRSTITGYLEGLPAGSVADKDSFGRITRICLTNSSILGLYKYAWQIYGACTVILNVSDSSKLTPPGSWDEWKYNNTFSYELMLPPSAEQQFHTRMQYDLQQFFGYSAALSKQGGKTVFIISESKNSEPTNR